MKKCIIFFLAFLLLFTACSKGGDGEAATELAETPTSLPTSTATPTATSTATPTATIPWQSTPVGWVEAKQTPDISEVPLYEGSNAHFANIMSYKFESSAGCEYKEASEFSSLTEYNLYVTEQLVQKKEYLDDLIRKNKIRKDVLYVHFVLYDVGVFSGIRFDGLITDEYVIGNLLTAMLEMKYVTKDVGDMTDNPLSTGGGPYMIICGEVDGEVVELFNTRTNLPSYGNKFFLGMRYTSDCYDAVERINAIETAVCDAACAKFKEAYFSAQNYPVVFD